MSEKIKIGLQLYSVRDLLFKDFVGTLKKVKELGYDVVEFAGYYGDMSAADLKKLLSDIGLEAVTTHCAMECFEKDFEGTVQFHKDLGLKYLAIPWMPVDMCPGKPGFDSVKDLFIKISMALKDNGIQLLYHNHDFEFFKVNNQLSYDILLSEIPNMNPEFDVCWVTYAKQSPVDYLKKYTGRVGVVHLKDFKGRKNDPAYALINGDGEAVKLENHSQENTFRFMPVGSGEVKMNEVINTAIECGSKYFIVEQDDCYGDPIGCIDQSRKWLKSIGL